MQEKYLSILPTSLRGQGIRLHEYGYYEYAWEYPVIKEVISACRDAGFAFIGCEFFLPPGDERREPEATIDTWYTSRHHEEDWEQFTHRSADDLIMYIETEIASSRGFSFWSSPDVVDEEEYDLLAELSRGRCGQVYPSGSPRRLAARWMYTLIHLLGASAARKVVARILTHHFAFSSEQQMQTASTHLRKRGYSVVSFPDDAQRWQLHASRECLPISWLEEREKKKVLQLVGSFGGEYLGSEMTEVHRQ